MTKIERDIIYAIRNRIACTLSNTCITFDGNICSVTLHGNLIAYLEAKEDHIKATFDTCRFDTRTTISRFNAIGIALNLKSRFAIHKGRIFYNKEPLLDKLEIFIFPYSKR